VNDSLIANRRIDHAVVNGAVRPFDFEILLDEIHALAVYRVHELQRFGLTLAAGQEAPHFVFSRSVEKHAQGVRAVAEKMLCSPSDDDRVSGLSGMLHNALGKLQNCFAVDQVELVGIEAAFVTSAQKGFE